MQISLYGIQKLVGLIVQIWNVAAVKLNDLGVVASEFNPGVNTPRRGFSAQTKYHLQQKGLWDGLPHSDMFKDGQLSEFDVLKSFQDFIEDGCSASIMLAHNVSFDRDVMLNGIRANGLSIVQHDLVFVETETLIRSKLSGLDSYSLGNVYKYLFKEEVVGVHNAYPDVQALFRVLKQLYGSELTDAIRRAKISHDIHCF